MHLLPLGTTVDILVWVLSAQRKYPLWDHHPGQALYHPCAGGFSGNKIHKPHTVPCKVTSPCGSVPRHLISAPRGTDILSAPVPKRLLLMAGIEDCYTSARGRTATVGNVAKVTFDAISETCSYFISRKRLLTKSPSREFTGHLAKTHTRASVPRTQAPAVPPHNFV